MEWLNFLMIKWKKQKLNVIKMAKNTEYNKFMDQTLKLNKL